MVYVSPLLWAFTEFMMLPENVASWTHRRYKIIEYALTKHYGKEYAKFVKRLEILSRGGLELNDETLRLAAGSEDGKGET
ncbi:MAG: hypothetical protein LBT40_04095 [Deltaproteobacteria bacterium]|nr:hypothetical protein [Deltaproteobacteria bacterium]